MGGVMKRSIGKAFLLSCALAATLVLPAFAQEPSVDIVHVGPGAPGSMAFAPDGTAYFTKLNGRIHKVSPSGAVSLIAGPPGDSFDCGFSGDGGPALAARFCYPDGIARDSAGNLYVADTSNHRIRKINVAGIVTTFAGTGTGGFSGDGGAAASALLNNPRGLAIDSSGNLYVSDVSNSRVRKITSAGIISTVAGSGAWGFSGDGGPATAASFYIPEGLAFDGAGNLYISDTGNNRVRRVSAAGIISTVVGSGPTGIGQGAFAGDGGPALLARLNSPRGIAFDKAGNTLYIADTGNFRIRKVDAAGQIGTIAGNGVNGSPAQGAPAAMTSLYPYSVGVDPGRSLWIDAYDLLKLSLFDLVVDDGANNSRPVASNDAAFGNIWNSLSQTFTAQWPRATFGFRLFNRDWYTFALLPDAGKPVVLNLYSGENSYSQLLASKTVVIPAQLSSNPRSIWGDVGFVMADFSAVALTVGARYTVEITLPSADLPASGERSNISVWTSLANPYPNGRFYFHCCYDNSYFASQDLLFKMTEVVESGPVAQAEAVEEEIVEALDDGDISSAVARLLLDSLTPIQAKLAWIAANPSSPDLARVKRDTCSLINQFNTQMDHYVRLRKLPANLRDAWKADMLEVKADLGCGS